MVESIDNNYIQSLANDARVARLATIDFEEARPHIVPVVFVFDGEAYYIPIDKKPKTDPKRLRRIRNIQKNPNVALLIDEYDDDWSKLFFVMIQGKGSLIGEFVENDDVVERKCNSYRYSLKNAQRLLLEKYPQYRKISMGQLCIMISPEKVFTWTMSRHTG